MSAIDNVLPALEALIFSSETPATAAKIRRVFKDLTPARIAEAVKAINTQLDKDGRPYQIAEVAGGYQFRTRPEYGEVLSAAQPERKVRLSRAALESLAVVAYRQPLTRAELEDLRSVDCGAVLKSLMDRDLVRIVGRRDAPGRPVLYGTSSNFLELFGLPSLRDLPTLREIENMAAERGVSIEEASADASEDADVEQMEFSDDAPADADRPAKHEARFAEEDFEEDEREEEGDETGALGDEVVRAEAADQEDWSEEEDAPV